MRGSNLLFLTSWLILIIVSAAIVLFSAESLWIASSGRPDGLSPGYTLSQIAEQGGEQAAKAFRGRRITAATWSLGYSLLALSVIWIPYRRGERWAWWALLVSLGVSQFLSLGRALALATTGGTAVPAILLAFVLLGLLAGVPRVFAKRVDDLGG